MELADQVEPAEWVEPLRPRRASCGLARLLPPTTLGDRWPGVDRPGRRHLLQWPILEPVTVS